MTDMFKILAKDIANHGGGAMILHGYIIGNVPPDKEWLKWLSYTPNPTILKIENIKAKKVSELTDDDFEWLSKYNRNKMFAKLFKVYGTGECSPKDYVKVYNFMCKESIEKLMLEKLTAEELQQAKQEIIRLSNISLANLRVIIKENKKKYEQLSMIDAYVLHMISKSALKEGLVNLDKEIDCQIKQNDAMRARSLQRSSSQYMGK